MDCPLWTSQPPAQSPAAPSLPATPDEMSWQTGSKPKEGKPTLDRGRGRRGEARAKALSMRGGAGPGQGQAWATPPRPCRSQREARAPHTQFSEAFQESAFALQDGQEFQGLRESIHSVPPPQSKQGLPHTKELRCPPLALRAARRRFLGWRQWPGARERVTGPAASGSSRSLTTGPHCYCFCGEPWSRTRRATPATPAPGRWGR